MQLLCFYHFPLVGPFSGNAVPLLLPFSSGRSIFGQCNSSAFTIFLWSIHFRAMQLLCFYHFPLVRPFSGNAASLLLPFSSGPIIFGQCSTSAFTIFLWSAHFWTIQPHVNCWYEFYHIKRTSIVCWSFQSLRNHFPACFCTFEACISTSLAMVMVMFPAFVAASFTNICAEAANLVDEMAVSLHRSDCHPANLCAFSVQPDAFCHHFYIFFF
jgi:hypothetical protein